MKWIVFLSSLILFLLKERSVDFTYERNPMEKISHYVGDRVMVYGVINKVGRLKSERFLIIGKLGKPKDSAANNLRIIIYSNDTTKFRSITDKDLLGSSAIVHGIVERHGGRLILTLRKTTDLKYYPYDPNAPSIK